MGKNRGQVHLEIKHWLGKRHKSCSSIKQYKFLVGKTDYLVSKCSCFELMRRFTGECGEQGAVGMAASQVSRVTGHELCLEKYADFCLSKYLSGVFVWPVSIEYRPNLRRYVYAYFTGSPNRNYVDITATVERWKQTQEAFVKMRRGRAEKELIAILSKE